MGFKIEEIVHPDARVLAEQFICSVCLCVMEEPVQTVCEHLFCAGCVSTALACPTCRVEFAGAQENLKPLRECNRPLLRVMHGLKVFCPYHSKSKVQTSFATPLGPPAKKQRKGECCDWEGSFSDLLATHLNQCAFHEVQCPNGCGQKMRRKDLTIHDQECACHLQECNICKVKMRAGDIAEHRKANAELHVALLEAQVAELRGAKVSADELKSSVLSAVAEAGIAQRVAHAKATRGGPHTVTWVATLKRQFKKGETVDSPKFDLCGMGQFHLSFYPAGNSNSADNHGGIFLLGPKNVRLQASLSVDDWQRTLLSELTVDSGRGFVSGTNGPPTPEVFPCDVFLKVDVISASLCTEHE